MFHVKHRKVKKGMAKNIDIEVWVYDLLNDIHESAVKGENFDLHLEASYVKEMDIEIQKLDYIEIY